MKNVRPWNFASNYAHLEPIKTSHKCHLVYMDTPLQSGRTHGGILENESPFSWEHFIFWNTLCCWVFPFIFLMIPGGYPLGIMWKSKLLKKKLMKICQFLCIVTHAFWDIPEIMCHQPPALGARYIMKTPTLGYYPTRNARLWGQRYVFQDGYHIFLNAHPLLFALFLSYPKGISWKKKSGKTNLMVPKP